MDYTQLGKRIREERLALNLTQESLAERVDVSDAYIGQIERGQRSLSLETLVKLAKRLGVTVDYLLQESVKADDQQFMDQVRQLVSERSLQEKQMVLDVIKLMLVHVEEIKRGS